MVEVLLAIMLVVFVPAFAWANYITWRNIRRALELVADPASVIEGVGRTLTVEAGQEDVFVPCALTRNSPFQQPLEMARVMVIQGGDSVQILDPYGSEDFVVSLPKTRRGKRFGFGHVVGRYGNSTSSTTVRASMPFRLVFRSEYLKLIGN